MNNRKYIIAGVVAVLFTFAGYNLYTYFKTQQAIQLEQDQRAEERRAARAEKAAQRETARIAAIAAKEKEAEARRAVQELENAKAAAEQAKKVEEDEARLAQQEAERLAFVEEKRLRREQAANDRSPRSDVQSTSRVGRTSALSSSTGFQQTTSATIPANF